MQIYNITKLSGEKIGLLAIDGQTCCLTYTTTIVPVLLVLKQTAPCMFPAVSDGIQAASHLTVITTYKLSLSAPGDVPQKG